jgi:hypothetical protein
MRISSAFGLLMLSDELQEEFDRLHERLDEILACFCSEDEYNTFNRMHNKLNILLDDDNREERVEIAQQTLEKFEDYMKNVDKLNAMINEIKGCAAMARSALLAIKEKENK